MIIAEPSPTAPRCPNTRSVSTAPAVEAPITSRALGPNEYTAAAISGTRVAFTVHMMRGVECGE